MLNYILAHCEQTTGVSPVYVRFDRDNKIEITAVFNISKN